MRAFVQRVERAAVSVSGELIGSIGKGICVFIGIHKNDTLADLEYLARKILTLRVFPDDAGNRWKHSVKDLQLEILSVSQFTLHCKLKGNKPNFTDTMITSDSKPFYATFLSQLRKKYLPDKVKDGEFGAYMSVDIVNDGPVSILLCSPSEKAEEKNPTPESDANRSDITK